MYTEFKQDKAVLQAKPVEDFDDSEEKERIFKETNKAYMIRLTLENETKISNDREHTQVLFGDLCVDAALCCSKTQDIIAKVQAKYPLNTLVDMLTDADCEDPHFKEVLLGLLRSAYIDPYRAKDQYDLLHKDFCAKIVHILNT